MIKTKKLPPLPNTIKVAMNVVENGGIVVFPWGKLERRCLAFMCDSKNKETCKRLNLIKTRKEDQVLAVNGYPELIPEIAKVDRSQSLTATSKRLGISLVRVLTECMKIGAVSFIFEAQPSLPKLVTNEYKGLTTVMVAGEIDHESKYDFYTQLIKALHKRHIITAGSSANRSATGTYHVFEQAEAYEDLKRDVDLFIYHNPLPKKPATAFNLESCTTFDMTVNQDFPEVVRFGSVHPDRFKKIFRKYSVSKKVKYLPKREKKHHILIKNLIRRLSLVNNVK